MKRIISEMYKKQQRLSEREAQQVLPGQKASSSLKGSSGKRDKFWSLQDNSGTIIKSKVKTIWSWGSSEHYEALLERRKNLNEKRSQKNLGQK